MRAAGEASAPSVPLGTRRALRLVAAAVALALTLRRRSALRRAAAAAEAASTLRRAAGADRAPPRRERRSEDATAAAPRRRGEREDLGPAVQGFGDAVPAFMLIPIPRPRREAATTADSADTEQEAA